MPRRRPGSVRAVVPRRERHRSGRAFSLGGLSAQACAEIALIEHQRPDLFPGAGVELYGYWSWFVRHPDRRRWDPAQGPAPDPWAARSLLDAVAFAMTPHRARELRRTLTELDDLY